jgi:protoheme IX farnesyltransferase
LNSEVSVFEGPALGVAQRLVDFLMLTKPRLLSMVLLTTLVGFYLASPDSFDLILALATISATALAAGGVLALNQYLERDSDARMTRTCHRPIASGKVQPREALAYATGTLCAGTLFLLLAVNWMTAAIIGIIAVLYLGAYTPLKRTSWSCNLVGAISGALPPVLGWVAARDSLGVEPLVLFAMMFLWQLPHALAIGELYYRDYLGVGLHLFPAGEARARFGNWIIVTASAALVMVSGLPAALGYAGRAYMVAAVGLAMLMLGNAMVLLWRPATAARVRRVVFASLVYLPVTFLALIFDRL